MIDYRNNLENNLTFALSIYVIEYALPRSVKLFSYPHGSVKVNDQWMKFLV